MNALRIDAGHVWLNTNTGHWTSLDDFEAWMIRAHNEILTARTDPTGNTCPDPRCHKLAHPDHANGHLLVGDTWPDSKQRRDARYNDF